MAGSTRANSGMAAGLLSTMRYLGGVVGIALLGALMADPADPRAHAAPVMAYGAALVCSALLAGWLPPSARKAAPVVATP